MACDLRITGHHYHPAESRRSRLTSREALGRTDAPGDIRWWSCARW